MGTSIIVNTPGVVAGTPQLAEVSQVVDFLLHLDTEQALVDAILSLAYQMESHLHTLSYTLAVPCLYAFSKHIADSTHPHLTVARAISVLPSLKRFVAIIIAFIV